MHAGRIVTLNLGRFARQEATRLIHLCGIVTRRNKPDTGAAAALYLILQAGARAGAEHRIRTGAQHEGACQISHCTVDRAGRGKRTEVVALAHLASTMFGQLAKFMVGGQQDLRQAFVVAQQNVVARLHLLDQVRFKKQRLGL